MKKIVILFLLLTACSQAKKENGTPFSVFNVTEDEWGVYEGRITNKDGKVDNYELSLKQASVGVDSYFKLNIFRNNYSLVVYGLGNQGNYSVSYGLPNHEQGLTINCHIESIKDKVITKEDGKKINILGYEGLDNLYFKTEGTEKLILTNSSFRSEPNTDNVLHKRSNLFTAEGYVTADSVTSEFFERNTMEKWNLSKLMAYDSIKGMYQKLATESNEGVYLKALAYSILDSDSTGQSRKLLVIKSILKMEKSSRFNRIE